MDLLEYQAKELFREMDIPVLPSQRIDRPTDLKGLKIPYPVVLKSQVRAGGRGKAGGVKFVENTIDAVAAAQTIFHLPIVGEYPEVLLAEAKYNADREFYLAVVLDAGARRPILLGSKIGGIDAEAVMEQMQLVVVDGEFSPFYARRLALKMGLEGNLIQAVSDILEKMYQLFVQKDLDLVEINPLGVSATGEVMALDGKVTANDDAIARHPDLVKLVTKTSNRPKMNASIAQSSRMTEEKAAEGDFPMLTLHPARDGNIGVLCNGAGLLLTTLDLIYLAGGKPASFLNIGEAILQAWTPTVLCDRLERGLELITRDKNVEVLLINLHCHATAGDRMAVVIAEYWQKRASKARLPNDFKMILRLVSSEFSRAQESLKDCPVTIVENLEQAIHQTMGLVKSKA